MIKLGNEQKYILQKALIRYIKTINFLLDNIEDYSIEDKDIKIFQLDLNDAKIFQQHLRDSNDLQFNKLQTDIIQDVLDDYKEHFICRKFESRIQDKNYNVDLYTNKAFEISKLKQYIRANEKHDKTDKFVIFMQQKEA